MMTPEQWNEFSNKINTIFILSDIVESLMFDAEKDLIAGEALSYDLKHNVKLMKKTTRKIVEMVNQKASIHNDNFTAQADSLRGLVYKEMNINN